jgi:hypothetical protein
MRALDMRLPKLFYITDCAWFDANASSEVLTKLIERQRNEERISMPMLKLKVEGLANRLGFLKLEDAVHKFIKYRRIS